MKGGSGATGHGSVMGNVSTSALNLNWWKDVNAATPLRVYLLESLKTLPMSMKSQKTMLSTWLCEIYLHQLSVAENIDNSNLGAVQREELTGDFQRFLREFRAVLDFGTVLGLLVSRNLRALLLYYTKVMGDYHRVVSILITGHKYSEAVSVLLDAPAEKVELFIYKVSPILMENEPEKTINMLLRKSHVSFSALLPTIMHYTSKLDQKLMSSNAARSDLDENYAVVYLAAVLEKSGLALRCDSDTPNDDHAGIDIDLWASSTLEPVLLHTFAWLLAKYETEESESRLVRFLSSLCHLREIGLLDEIVTIDAEYLLRICRMFHRKRSAIHSLLLLRNSKQAVKESLQFDANIAKDIAIKERDPSLKKVLWMEIGSHIISHDPDIKHAISVIIDSDGALQIEVNFYLLTNWRNNFYSICLFHQDLLPLLPDFTEIDLFKTEICASLEESSDRIGLVREDMTRLALSVDNTVQVCPSNSIVWIVADYLYFLLFRRNWSQ